MANSIRLYVLTFNCAKSLIDVDAFSSQLHSTFKSSYLPDLIIISLQEIAPLSYSFIGGSFLTPFLKRFNDAIQSSLKASTDDRSPYLHVVTHTVGSTGLIIFAKNASAITDVETAGVGLGLWGLGNKGAAGVRLRYQNTLLTFVAAHLAAMERQLQKRNENWKNIVKRLVFDTTMKDRLIEETPLLDFKAKDGFIYKVDSYLFIAGDLNYRTSLLPPSYRDYVDAFPQPHYPPSDERHFTSLLKLDQLTEARRANETFHGLIEAEITFPPTYKYQISSNRSIAGDESYVKWNWAAHRWPSWCDRILYLDLPSWLIRKDEATRIKVLKYDALSVQPTSDHRPVLLEVEVPLLEIHGPREDEETNDPRIHPPFNIDPDWKTQYTRARSLELSIGWALWLTTTWEGGSLSLVALVGLMVTLQYL